jgi:uncharacterized membrane protein YgcG
MGTLPNGEATEVTVSLSTESGRFWDHSPKLSGLTIQTSIPGGEESASWQLTDGDPYTELAPPAVEVEIRDRLGRFRHMRLEKPSGRFENREGDLKFVARGWSSHAGDDKFADSMVFLAGTTIEQCFIQARDMLCPLFSNSNARIVATGKTLATDSEDFGGKSAQDVFNWAAGLGGVQWGIWSQSDGPPVLVVEYPPTEADYVIILSENASADLGWDLQTLYNRVLLKWAGGYVYADDLVNQKPYPDGVGVRRTYFVDMANAVTNEGDAQLIADDILTNFGELAISGLGITIPFGTTVHGANGDDVAPWMVEAGRRVIIQDLTLPETLLRNTFIIQTTVYDEDNGDLTLQPVPEDVVTDLVLRAQQKTVGSSLGSSAGSVSGGGGSSGGSGGGGSGGGSGGSGLVLGTTVRAETTFGLVPDPGTLPRASSEGHSHGTPDLGALFTAKGDLLVGTGPGTFEILHVGPPGSTLFADPSEAGGMRWDFFTVRTVSPPPIVVEAVLVAPEVYRTTIVTPPPIVVELILPAPDVHTEIRITPPPIVIEAVLPAPDVHLSRIVTPPPIVVELVLPAPTVTVAGAPMSGIAEEILGGWSL